MSSILQQAPYQVVLTYLYQKYTVYRKMPMMVNRHERTLAIDGVYIHVRFPLLLNVENSKYRSTSDYAVD
jgi:hypothetical protein